MQEQNSNNNQKSVRDFVFILQTFSFSVEAILRYGFGERYLGWQSLAAFPLIFLYGVVFSHDGPWMFAYLGLYTIMYVKANAGKGQLISAERPHTRYNGFPRLLRFFPKCSERRMKTTIEPLFVFLFGLLACVVSPGLGSFLIIAACSMGFHESSLESFEQHRVLDLHDSVIDQKSVAERFRRMNRDHD